MILNKALRMVLALVFSIASLSVTALAAPVTTESPPYPLPVQDPAQAETYEHIEGVQDAAGRFYNESMDSPYSLQFAVAVFDTAEHAQAALPVFEQRFTDYLMEVFGNNTGVQRQDLEVPAGFDTFSGLFLRTEAYSISMVTGTVDNIFYMGSAFTNYQFFDPRLVPWVESAYLNPPDRGEGTELVPTWGIWGLLPDPSEMGARYHSDLVENFVPRTFGKIPPD